MLFYGFGLSMELFEINLRFIIWVVDEVFDLCDGFGYRNFILGLTFIINFGNKKLFLLCLLHNIFSLIEHKKLSQINIKYRTFFSKWNFSILISKSINYLILFSFIGISPSIYLLYIFLASLVLFATFVISVARLCSTPI